jgi:hypothetical protein
MLREDRGADLHHLAASMMDLRHISDVCSGDFAFVAPAKFGLKRVYQHGALEGLLEQQRKRSFTSYQSSWHSTKILYYSVPLNLNDDCNSEPAATDGNSVQDLSECALQALSAHNCLRPVVSMSSCDFWSPLYCTCACS